MVMEPLEELVKGAERIRNGNLKEKISYRGEKELEDVCRTFNSMQDTILEDKRRQEQNEKARTDMVVGISHDLRTPLTSIQGYMKGILDGVADTEEKKRKYLKTAYEASKDMNVLLQKLCDFSRLESYRGAPGVYECLCGQTGGGAVSGSGPVPCGLGGEIPSGHPAGSGTVSKGTGQSPGKQPEIF